MRPSTAVTVAFLSAIAASTVASAKSQRRIGEEPVMSALVDDAGITFQVPTGGCTGKENFGLETISPKPLTVRLLRIRPDYCEAFVPDGVKVHFTFAEIGAGAKLDAEAQKTLVILNASK